MSYAGMQAYGATTSGVIDKVVLGFPIKVATTPRLQQFLSGAEQNRERIGGVRRPSSPNACKMLGLLPGSLRAIGPLAGADEPTVVWFRKQVDKGLGVIASDGEEPWMVGLYKFFPKQTEGLLVATDDLSVATRFTGGAAQGIVLWEPTKGWNIGSSTTPPSANKLSGNTVVLLAAGAALATGAAVYFWKR